MCDKFEKLNNIYLLLPSTTCHKESCANWCCTKLESKIDEHGIYMPLPLVYGIEYLNILDYLLKEYGSKVIEEKFDFLKKTRLCPFKDSKSRRCLIYPVRPFSCRIYGRKVPPIFWGVKVPPKQAKSVFCPDMSVDESEKQKQFLKEYPKMWNTLAELSYDYSPFTEWQKMILQEKIGVPVILVLAFGEYYFLSKQSKEWYQNYFKTYWGMMGNKL
ncbi:hypothetical protein BVX93_00510 [bacterium B13(2017)]|nr:hypothetical protein BVX93_00510 [bacterium B13(2017)]